MSRPEIGNPQKLTQAKADEIREKYRTVCTGCGRRPTMKMIAEEFNISDAMVHQIIHGHAWKK